MDIQIIKDNKDNIVAIAHDKDTVIDWVPGHILHNVCVSNVEEAKELGDIIHEILIRT